MTYIKISKVVKNLKFKKVILKHNLMIKSVVIISISVLQLVIKTIFKIISKTTRKIVLQMIFK